MSILKKKADTGAYEPGAFGEVGPMNEHNDFKWYNESIWNKDTGYKGPYPAAGTEGDPTSHAPRNEMISTQAMARLLWMSLTSTN